MKHFRTTFLLVLLFAGLLGASLLLNPTRQVASTPPPTTFPEVFPGVAQTQITQITLERRSTGRKISMTRVPGDWTASDENGHPVQVDLNQVARMLQILSTLRYNRVMEGSDVQPFGLSDGGLFIVNFDAGAHHTLHIGDLNSDLTYTYIQRESEVSILQVPAVQVATLIRMVNDQSGTP